MFGSEAVFEMTMEDTESVENLRISPSSYHRDSTIHKDEPAEPENRNMEQNNVTSPPRKILPFSVEAIMSGTCSSKRSRENVIVVQPPRTPSPSEEEDVDIDVERGDVEDRLSPVSPPLSPVSHRPHNHLPTKVTPSSPGSSPGGSGVTSPLGHPMSPGSSPVGSGMPSPLGNPMSMAGYPWLPGALFNPGAARKYIFLLTKWLKSFLDSTIVLTLHSLQMNNSKLNM